MQKFTVACAQMGFKPNDVDYNLKKALEWICRAAEEHGAELVVFPETISTGFMHNLPYNELYRLVEPVPGRFTEAIGKVAREKKIHVCYPTYERGEKDGIIYNSATLIDDSGAIIGNYRKTHPFISENAAFGGWVTAGTAVKAYDTRLGKIGMIICYDGDFPELSRELALQGAEIILRPAALLRSYDIWYLTSAARAFDNHVYMAAVNAVGSDAAGCNYFGNSLVIDPRAVKLAQARGVEEIVSAQLDPDPLRFVTQGSKEPMVYNHIDDRNLEVYRNIARAGNSPFPRAPVK
ncbi:MAG: carbon-nitrogen hydrolase family protein [Bacillota bacterium]